MKDNEELINLYNIQAFKGKPIKQYLFYLKKYDTRDKEFCQLIELSCWVCEYEEKIVLNLFSL